MSGSGTPEELALARRLEREHRARRQAEEIAERVTAALYAAAGKLESANEQLTATNDELQAVNASMREFIAVASHDLRSPLTSIIGYSDLLQDRWGDISDPQRSQFLAAINRQGLHMNRLVEALLTVSRIEAGALDVHQEVVRLKNAIDDATEAFLDGSAPIDVAPGCEEIAALVDPEHLNRILVNFITNAMKYGAPPVEIAAIEAGPWVEIRISDHGNGVPDELVPRLFGRFARADDEESRARGVGLGLSIVRGLAQANGGDAWYEPNEPSGACFGLRLPSAAA